jgi:hypothetical protein
LQLPITPVALGGYGFEPQLLYVYKNKPAGLVKAGSPSSDYQVSSAQFTLSRGIIYPVYNTNHYFFAFFAFVYPYAIDAARHS